jgi:enoyl-CoA hydratase
MALVEKLVEDGVGWMVLNRPEKLNALNPALLNEFDTVLAELSDDDGVRCIVIKGEGRAFSVGYDLGREHSLYSKFTAPDEGRTRSYVDWRRLRANVDRWLNVWRCPKPVIAAINGYCIGGATQLAVCCDLTVVAEDASIGWPMLPMGGGLLSPTSEWLIGPKRAKELSYIAGSKFTGKVAVEWGWANRAVEESALMDTVKEMAHEIAKIPADVLYVKKKALNRIMDMQGFAESLYFGAEFDAIAHDSEGCADLAAHVASTSLKETINWYHDRV